MARMKIEEQTTSSCKNALDTWQIIFKINWMKMKERISKIEWKLKDMG